jgi:hypothetical protein
MESRVVVTVVLRNFIIPRTDANDPIKTDPSARTHETIREEANQFQLKSTQNFTGNCQALSICTSNNIYITFTLRCTCDSARIFAVFTEEIKYFE